MNVTKYRTSLTAKVKYGGRRKIESSDAQDRRDNDGHVLVLLSE